jgi:hypothetical protein
MPREQINKNKTTFLQAKKEEPGLCRPGLVHRRGGAEDYFQRGTTAYLTLPVWEDATTANKQNNQSMQLDPGPDNARADMSAMRGGGSVAIALPKDHACQKIESATASV